jgi:hypothetical protein
MEILSDVGTRHYLADLSGGRFSGCWRRFWLVAVIRKGSYLETSWDGLRASDKRPCRVGAQGQRIPPMFEIAMRFEIPDF